MDRSRKIRVLIVDDEPVIHRVFKAILKRATDSTVSASANPLEFVSDSAYQGQEAIDKLKNLQSSEEGATFDLAFVDMSMPPGIGGIETIQRLWELDPLLPVVICTASTDITSADIIADLGVSDRLQILKKPLDMLEVQQLVLTISARRDLENVARLQMEELDRRVQERTADLQTAVEEAEVARKEAEKANQLKSQFLANMSHELRTPLNGVLGMLDILMETDLSDRQREYSSISQRSARSLLAIINDILDYSKIEADELKLEAIPMDLRRMLEEISALGAAQVNDKEVEVILNYSPEMPPGIIGDPLRLRQVLTNLLNNALKFTKEGHVVLEAKTIEESTSGSTKIRFAVRDTGVGIAPERLEHIFRKFTQADGSTTREFGGTGLGLAISSHLVQLMGTSIEVQSEVDVGSEFFFELTVEESSLPETDEQYPELSQARVLVVDDLQLNREILMTQLRSHVHSVETAESAEDALRMIADDQDGFDLVVTDFQMPFMDGQELGKRIRSDDSLPQPKLVLLSSNCVNVSQQELNEIGFQDYLIKPATRHALLSSARAVLGQKTNSAKPHLTKEPVDISRLKVLVADDNQINQLVAEECLINLGVKSVVLADNGEQALAAAKNHDFDMIFMDCQMPVMDGYEASRQIRKLAEPKSQTPIVALTANALAGDKETCLAAGMNAHLPKPFQPHEMKAMLDEFTRPSVQSKNYGAKTKVGAG